MPSRWPVHRPPRIDPPARLAARLGERIVEVRGSGFLRGIQVHGEAGKVVAAARERGVLVIVAGPDVVRLAPALIAEPGEIDTCLEVLEGAISSL